MKLVLLAMLLVSLKLVLTASGMSPGAPGAPPPPPKKTFRMRNGIRLAGASGGIGRLEVSSKDSWFAERDAEKDQLLAAWSPVCDSKLFDDGLATAMCEMLGYPYGRKYYDPKLNFRTISDESANQEGPLPGYVRCDSAISGNRRALRGLGRVAGAAAQAHRVASSSGAEEPRDGVTPRRSLYSPVRGTICTPRTSPYRCEIFPGPCNPTGPLVAIECSEEPMPLAPPPPPRPPTPPPAPPAVSDSIRLIGGRFDDFSATVEPNLCPGDDDFCSLFGRVEVQVEDPSVGEKVWAPLCASMERQGDWALAGVVCGQVYNWPKMLDGGLEMTIPGLREEPFPVPTGSPVDEGLFKPAQYKSWVTVEGVSGYPRSVQEFDLQVSSKPCKSLLAIQCTAYGSGLPEWPGLYGEDGAH